MRRATLADKPAIFEFIREAYRDRWQHKIPLRWEWEFENNPFKEGEELPVWIAVDGSGRVVGQTCALVEPLKLGDAIFRVGWSVDTYLLPEFRGRGLGYELQKANDAGNRVFMSLDMSPANRHIKAKLGSVALEPVARFTRPLRTEPEYVQTALLRRLRLRGGGLESGLRWLLRVSGTDRFLAHLINTRFEARDSSFFEASEEHVAIRRIDRFGPKASRLWEEVAAHFHAMVARTPEYLNWKFVDQPGMAYRCFLAEKEGRVVGSLILRLGRPPEPEVGIVADLLAHPDDRTTIMGMIGFALRFLKDEGARYVSAATTVKSYQACLVEAGFREVGQAVPMMHCRLPEADCANALVPGAWFLGKGDHDWDQYPLAT